MAEEILEFKKLCSNASHIKNVMLKDRNIEILLYLAKYNPGTTIKNLVKLFGEKSLNGLKELEKCSLVRERGSAFTLTEEGIFQVQGLLSMAM